ncbi:MAG: peptidase E [Chloroflexi bacterium]|nr:peptidase E [Chloroflexota bacterium]
MAKHIVAIGGAGLGEPLLIDYLLQLTGQPRPRVLYLPTASGDAQQYVLAFYEAMAAYGVRASCLPLFFRRAEDLAPIVLEQDVIYVGGGNTANMLAVWRLHGLDKLLAQAWEQGTVLCGASAGSLCWFECGITDSFGLQLATLHDGLGFLAGSNCPHYDSEARRRPVYTQAVAAGFPAGYAADDAVGLHFEGGELREAVSARLAGRAFHVQAPNGEAVEAPLPVRYLG